MSDSKVINVTSAEQFEQLKKDAQGPVVMAFTAQGCGYCDIEKPKIAALANSCEQATVLNVDVDAVPTLADAFNITGMPTVYVAKSGAQLTPGKAKEVEGADAAAALLKCPRKK